MRRLSADSIGWTTSEVSSSTPTSRPTASGSAMRRCWPARTRSRVIAGVRIADADFEARARLAAAARTRIGNRIERWRLSEDSDGNSVSRVIDYVLGGMGAVVGDQYDDFLFSKAADLREIQEGMFDEIAK
jgi:hypothetical protein